MHNSRNTTVLLIRHAHTDAVGRWLAGRTSGIPLSARGAQQADRLGRVLARACPLDAVYSSPIERALETAAAIARHQPVAVVPSDGITEVEFGAWTGRTFDELNADPAWRQFNVARASASVPGGERAADVQDRVTAAIAAHAAAHPGGTVALVSHADVIRYAVLRYRGLSLDDYGAVTIGPASVTRLVVSTEATRVEAVGEVTDD